MCNWELHVHVVNFLFQTDSKQFTIKIPCSYIHFTVKQTSGADVATQIVSCFHRHVNTSPSSAYT